MFINKNVKSLKNVHKTKHHKRNKNKKRSIKKLSIKHMRGGSGNTSDASASASANIHIPTLLELIKRQSKDGTMCEIHYDDVKIICLLGNNNVKLGYDNLKNRGCIVINYYKDEQNEKIYYNAKLDSFFFGMPKQKCLYSKNINSKSLSLINNSIVYDEQKRKKKVILNIIKLLIHIY